MTDSTDNPTPQTAEEVASQMVEVPSETMYEAIRRAAFRHGKFVSFDTTVMFGKDYDFEGMEHLGLSMLTDFGGYFVWPNRLGGTKKWSAYCDREGGMMFEKFDSAESAEDWCVRDYSMAYRNSRIPPQGEQPPPDKVVVSRETLRQWRMQLSLAKTEAEAYAVAIEVNKVLKGGG